MTQKHFNIRLFCAVCCALLTGHVNGQSFFTNDSVGITIESGLTVTISGGGLENQGASNLDINGTLVLTGNWVNNAATVQDAGVVHFNGTAQQTITGANTFYNVKIGSDDSVKISSGVQKIINEVKIDSGVFDTRGDSLILISNTSGTARIIEIESGGDVYGDITMERYIDAGVTGFHFISSAVSGATVADWDAEMILSISDGDDGCAGGGGNPCWESVKRYDETVTGVSTGGFTGITTVTYTILSGVGYLVYTGTGPSTTTAFTFDVTGPANKFSTTLPVSYTSTPLTDDDGWNLVGNPYPCAIDWDKAGWTKTSIDNAIYIWDPDAAVYAEYVGGVGANGGTKDIASSQAFWVKATANTPPVLTVTEPVKTSLDPTYFKMNNHIPNVFRMSIVGNSYSHETVIRFKDDATAGFDGDYDAYKLTGSSSPAPNISTIIGAGLDLSINSMGPLTGSIVIPVRTTVDTSGSYTIIAGSFDDMPTTSCILLEDQLTGIFTNLRTTNSYTFTISDTTVAPRFLLHIGAPVFSDGDDVACKYDNNGSAVAKGSGGGPWDYIWQDSNGDTLQNNTSVAGNDSMTGLGPGIYIFTVVDVNGICATQTDTVTIAEPDSLLTLAAITTDLACFGDANGTVAITATGGLPTYNYLWSTGQTTADLINLSSGSYTVDVTDQNGCVKTASAVINEPNAISVVPQSTNVGCFGDNTGTIDISTSGGTPAYTYSWSTGETSEDITGLFAGTYNVTITDGNGCTTTPAAITIEEGLLLIAGYSATPIITYLDNGGEVQFTSTSTGAASYLWDFADGNTSTDLNPLHIYTVTGNYSVKLTIYNGVCEDTRTDIITVLNSTKIINGNAQLDDLVSILKVHQDVIVRFNLEKLTQVKIEMFNTIGQNILITNAEVQQSDIVLDLPDLAFGAYLIKVQKIVLGE